VKNHQTRFRINKPPHEKVLDTEVNDVELGQVISEFKTSTEAEVGSDFPQDQFAQLIGSINAVFGSWMAEKAVTYRRVENISGLDGTAVTCSRWFLATWATTAARVCASPVILYRREPVSTATCS